METFLGPPQAPSDDKRWTIVTATARRHGWTGIRLRQFGQSTIELLAGKVSSPLTIENRDRILAQLPQRIAIDTRTLDWFKREMKRFREEIRSFANFPTLFMGLVGEDGGLERYDGKLRFLDSGVRVIAAYTGATYMDHIAEIAHPWSYLKSSFYKPNGYPIASTASDPWRGLT
jgi:NAD-reducing hydrogenase large subunit